MALIAFAGVAYASEPVGLPKKEAEPEQRQSGQRQDTGGRDVLCVEQQAQFPGGNGGLTKWIGENLVYPEEARQQGIEGKVIVQFIIDAEGYISDPVIVRGVDRALDMEAIRLVNAMPKWEPGRLRGVPVRSKFILPVVFKLQHVDPE